MDEAQLDINTSVMVKILYQYDKPFWRRSDNKIFKMAAMAAILVDPRG